MERGFERLPLRVLLALVSGTACGLYLVVFGGFDFEPLDYGLPGLFFAAAVLFPHVERRAGFVARAVGLVVASGFAFWCAVKATVDVSAWLGFNGALGPFGLRAFLLGSFTGAAITLVAARFLIPLRTGMAYWLFGAAAAALGGGIMYACTEWVRGDLIDVAGFAVWHVLLCLAIHFGRAPSPASAQSAVAPVRA